MSAFGGVDVSAIVLAAGRGARMRSNVRKPLHRLAGAPMLAHVVDALSACRPDRIVVVLGPDDETVAKEMQSRTGHLPLDVAEQSVPRGTGDAAACGLAALPDPSGDPEAGELIIVPGDAPLMRPATLRSLTESHLASGAACTLLTARLSDPSGYGRIVRGRDGAVSRIVEQADASPAEAAIDEVAASVYVVRRSFCGPALRRIRPDNAAGEFYLTDMVQVLAQMGLRVEAFSLADWTEVQGVNNQEQLACARAEINRRVVEGWLRAGVAIVDPANTYLDVTVRLAAGVVLLPGVVLEGCTVVGKGAVIGPHTRLVDCAVGAEAVVEMSCGTDAEIGPRRRVGPFAVLGPAPPPYPEEGGTSCNS